MHLRQRWDMWAYVIGICAGGSQGCHTSYYMMGLVQALWILGAQNPVDCTPTAILLWQPWRLGCWGSGTGLRGDGSWFPRYPYKACIPPRNCSLILICNLHSLHHNSSRAQMPLPNRIGIITVWGGPYANRGL